MTRFNKMRLLSLFSSLPLILFGVLAVLLYQRIFAGDPQMLPSALIGKPVPEFSLPALTGTDVPGLNSKDLQSGKNTLVNVWASWCVPCRAEHPNLMTLANLGKQQGFALVSINYKDQSGAAQKFISDYGNPFSAIGADESGRISIDFGVYGVPESFVVSGDGRILFKHVGPLNAEVIGSDILPLLQGKKK